MADRLRIVQTQWPRRPVVVLDIASASILPIRDTFKIDAGKKTRTSVPVPGRTSGSRVVGERMDNAALSCTLALYGAATKDIALQQASQLLAAIDQVSTGLSVEWRPDGATRSVYFEIRGTGDWDPQYKWIAFSSVNYLAFGVHWDVAPVAYWDSMDVYDPFDLDTIAAGDWTVDTGTTPTVSGGGVVPANTNTYRIRYTANGYQYGDVQHTAEYLMGASVAAMGLEVYICGSGGTGGTAFDTYLYASMSATTLSVGKRVANSATSLNSTGLVPVAAGTYSLRVRREGPRVIAEAFGGADASPLQTVLATTEAQLSVAEQAVFKSGYCGVRSDINDTAERLLASRIEPFTYRSVSLPDVIRLQGLVPGDTAARCDLHLTTSGAGTGSGDASGVGGETFPIWMMAGWAPKPLLHNDCWNGDFEDDANGIQPRGWAASAVAGVIGAATSILADSTSARIKYGARSATIITPATTDTGAWFFSWQKFRKGRKYLHLFWASSAAQVTAFRAKLGISGDVATGAAAALTTTPQLYWVVWSPTADRDGAYLAAGVNAATATTVSIDGVNLVDTVPVDLAVADAVGTTAVTALQFTATPDELPATPFWMLLDNEIIRVTSTATTTWTVERAQEGTAAATHIVNTPGYVFATLRSHLEGKGASSPFGIIEAEACDTGSLDTPGATKLAIVADANYRTGGGLKATATSGAGSSNAGWIVDPNLLVADDYTDVIEVTFYARVQLAGTLVLPRIVLRAFPLPTTLGSYWRYSNEYQSQGILLFNPAHAGPDFRFTLLGTIPFPIDRLVPARWRLETFCSWAAGSSGAFGIDYLDAVPAAANMRYAERQPYDSTYGVFVGNTSETTRIVKWDGSGWAARPPQPPAQFNTPGGKLLRLPPGVNDVVVKLSTMVPNDPTGITTGGVFTSTLTDSEFQSHASTVHVAVQPASLFGRGA